MNRTALFALFLCLSFAGACDAGSEEPTTHRQLESPLKGGISCDCPDCSFWAQVGPSILVTLDADLMEPLIEATEGTDQGWLSLPLDDGRTLRVPVPFKELVYIPPGPPGDDAEYFFQTSVSKAVIESSADEAPALAASSLDVEDYELLLEALGGADEGVFRAAFGNSSLWFTVPRCD